MSTATRAHALSEMDLYSRVEAYAWPGIAEHLDAYGWAMIEKLLTADECAAIAALYEDDTRFRSRVVMARHGFGRGEYKYFRYPLPATVADLRWVTSREFLDYDFPPADEKTMSKLLGLVRN